jgi:hypothetical protein
MLFADANEEEENGPIKYTPTEAAMIGRLALVRVRADKGDKKAKSQIATMARQLAALKKQGKRNARAARAARVLEESGLLVSSQTFVMDGVLDGIDIWNAALLAAFGGLAVTGRWGWAAIPAGVFVVRTGRAKRWW